MSDHAVSAETCEDHTALLMWDIERCRIACEAMALRPSRPYVGRPSPPRGETAEVGFDVDEVLGMRVE